MDSQTYYDLLAQEYEEQNEFWDNPYDNEIWRLEHEIIAPYLRPTEPLLDVGCGFYPHDNFPTTIPIVAGDISLPSLLVAQKHLPPGRMVDLIQFDAHHLPFKNASFYQAIAGGELLNHVNYDIALTELTRVICPNGILLIEFGTKWCLDSLWAVLDSFIGHRIGYSVSKKQAMSFFRCDGSDPEVTWEITPKGRFTLKLLSVSNVKNALKKARFRIEKIVSTNCLSGLIPLPWQQDSERPKIQSLAKCLIRLDRLIGRIYPLNLFAGNVFFLCRRLRE